ncbi:hypothetical protein H5410_040959 [Solanum commersonii]|uniref:AIPP2-like SPOC-like domain-containing protein n=1 Tax=Solanum commersonii TaxID=4109 RepID=A0A9J5XRN0_SOLCO|nr:hypothetical protein H5410_040959 [Solanum commersonii]
MFTILCLVLFIKFSLFSFLFSPYRHHDKFDSMVQDMIGGEHALREFIPYGELLVITSTELPLRHWNVISCSLITYLRNLLAGYQRKCYLWGIKNQTPHNVLAARYAVNDRAPTKDDAQVMMDQLGRGKRIRKKFLGWMTIYDCSRD